MGPRGPDGAFAFTLSETGSQMSLTPLAVPGEQNVGGRGRETREEAAAMV